METENDQKDTEPTIPSTGFTDAGNEISYPGKGFPVVELGPEGWFSQDPRLINQADAPSTIIERHWDEHGILLNDIGEQQRFIGLKFNERDIYLINEKDAETGQYYVAWFDDNWQPHHLLFDGARVTGWMLRKIQTRSINGDLNFFPELTSD